MGNRSGYHSLPRLPTSEELSLFKNTYIGFGKTKLEALSNLEKVLCKHKIYLHLVPGEEKKIYYSGYLIYLTSEKVYNVVYYVQKGDYYQAKFIKK